ncbi:unnamed protein product [Auanema sp. JU1783]|nr:unnamed protein product [Auanema sp. JU1783]
MALMNRPNEPINRLIVSTIHEKLSLTDNIFITSMDSYKYICELGRGRFGTVCKYLNEDTKTHVAVKAIKMEIFEHGYQYKEKLLIRLNRFLEEFKDLKNISMHNDRIVDQIGIYAEGREFYVLTEYITNGSVKDYISREGLSEQKAVRYLQETLKALHFIHNLKITHRDVKAANLLISSNDSIKLANFGLIRDLAVDGMGLSVASEIARDFRGSLLYVAPEVLTSELGPGFRDSYSFPADIWSLGCTFIEMLIKFPPHFEYFKSISYNQNEIVERACGSKTSLPYTGAILVPSATDATKSIVDTIFEIDPKDRLTAHEMLEYLSSKSKKPLTVGLMDQPKTEPRIKPKLISLPAVEEPDGDAPAPVHFTKSIQEDYMPLETIRGGVTRKKKGRKHKQRTQISSLSVLFLYLVTRLLFFMKILAKSVMYVLVFISLGIGTLSFFLFVAYVFVLFFRYLIKLGCRCDLSEPHFLVISGILLILLFALLFSCCMVAIGETKHRISIGLFDDTTVFVPKPKKDVRMCGVTVLEGEKTENELSSVDDIPAMNESAAQDDFYYLP